MTDLDILQDFRVSLRKRFPLGVPRLKIGEATGGILHPRTMCNADNAGRGVRSRFKIGRQTIYPVDGLVDYLKKRMHENISAFGR